MENTVFSLDQLKLHAKQELGETSHGKPILLVPDAADSKKLNGYSIVGEPEVHAEEGIVVIQLRHVVFNILHQAKSPAKGVEYVHRKGRNYQYFANTSLTIVAPTPESDGSHTETNEFADFIDISSAAMRVTDAKSIQSFGSGGQFQVEGMNTDPEVTTIEGGNLDAFLASLPADTFRMAPIAGDETLDAIFAPENVDQVTGEFVYVVDPESASLIPTNERVAGDTTGQATVRHFLDTVVEQPAIWKNMCDLAQQSPTLHRPFTVRTRFHEGNVVSAGVIRKNGVWVSIDSIDQNGTGRLRNYGMGEHHSMDISLANVAKVVAQEVYIHENGHLIAPFPMSANLCTEGVAQCAVALYAMENRTSLWDVPGPHGYRTLHGNPDFGYRFPNGIIESQIHMPAAYALSVRMAGILMYEALGEHGSHEQRLANFREMVARLQYPNVDTDDQSLTYWEALTLQKFLAKMESVVSAKHFNESPISNPIADGERVVWVPSWSPHIDQKKSPWGMIFSLDLQTNPQCGLVQRTKRKTLANVDKRVGTEAPIPYKLRCRREDHVFTDPEKSAEYTTGIGRLCPLTILSIANENGLPQQEFQKPFAVDILLPTGEWKCLGDNYYIDQLDVLTMLNNQGETLQTNRAHDETAAVLDVNTQVIDVSQHLPFAITTDPAQPTQ